MAKQKKFDGVIQAVHYKPDGQIDWVRVFLKRGKVFSDRLIIDRRALVEQLKAGKNFFVGDRVQYLGATFKITNPVTLVKDDGKEILISGDLQSKQDCLDGVPLI